jgi:hypothetical protein
MRIHAIVLALNEEPFIANQLRTLYPLCSGISVLSQYDRDWYGKAVVPDRTLDIVANFPDPEGKIHLVVRRWPDEAGARNSEILALSARPHRGIMSHGSPVERIRAFHEPPDYFLIVDADEFYDPDSWPNIVDYLAAKKPRGMRVHYCNYRYSWNHRVVRDIMNHCHFGFVRPGVLFEMRRTASWNEQRMMKLFHILHLPDVSARLWGFITCPPDVGIYHHGCWLGSRARLLEKASKHSHPEINNPGYPDHVAESVTEFVPTAALPRSIREAAWMEGYLEDGPGANGVSGDREVGAAAE